MMVSISSTVFASATIEDVDRVQVNEIISTDDGEEIVIVVEEDGSFVTAPLGATGVARYACSHSSLQLYGYPMESRKSLNGTSASYCYERQEVRNAVCRTCQMSGIKVYGSLSYESHSFPWFSKTCSVCSYVK